MKLNLRKLTLDKAMPWILIIGGIVGIIGSFILTYDRLQIASNSSFVPNCNLNPIISCGSVMTSSEGSVFGFPNSFIGLAAFAAFVTIGVAMLAGAKFKRWFWLGLQAGTILGVIFVHWLFYQSVYTINSLCPYCISVWIVVITSFVYVSFYNVDHGYWKISSKYKNFYDWKRRHHLDILVSWLVVIALLILKHFWYYYGHYF